MTAAQIEFDQEIGQLLEELSEIQQHLLDHLAEKEAGLATQDAERLSAASSQEEQLLHRLRACHQQREQLLARARQHGITADSIASLATRLHDDHNSTSHPKLTEASKQARLLRHRSLTNWVLTQRHLLHVSQMLEIFATGGKMRPTYDDGESAHRGGTLVDQAI